MASRLTSCISCIVCSCWICLVTSTNDEMTPTVTPSTRARHVVTFNHRRALARMSNPRIVPFVARPSRSVIISGRSRSWNGVPSSRTIPQSASRKARPTRFACVVPKSAAAVALHSKTTPFSSCRMTPTLVKSRKSTVDSSVSRLHVGNCASLWVVARCVVWRPRRRVTSNSR